MIPGPAPERPSQPHLRPHVCFLSSSAPLAPGDTYSPFILDLAEALDNHDYRVTILTPHVAGSAVREVLRGISIRRARYLPESGDETLGQGGGMLPGLRQRPWDVFKIPSLLLAQFQSLEELHRDDPVEVLHTHWMLPQGVIGALFANAHGIPHVATAHGSDLLGLKFPGFDLALRLVAAQSDHITVNSNAMKRALHEKIGPYPTSVVPVGARRPKPSAVAGNLDFRRSLSRGAHVVGFVGRIVREKGIHEFIRSVWRLRQGGLEVVGLIVGGGSADKSARDLARELGVRDFVRFQGPVPPEEVFSYMSVMDLLIVPSHFEAQGIVAIEAMLLGVPVVAFHTGGLSEIVVDQRTGLTAEVGDLDGLIESCERLLRESGLRASLIRRAHQVAEERFTLGAGAQEFRRIYQDLLS